MKKLILIATFLAVGTLGVLAQGELQFSNASYEAWDNPAIDRTVRLQDGSPIDDMTYTAQLWQWVGGNPEPVGDAAMFGLLGPGLEGYWLDDGVRRNPTVSTLSVAIYQNGNLIAYGGGAGGVGSTFEYTKRNSVPPSPGDVLMHNFVGFTVPEPSTIALGVLGLGALLLFRRRK